MGRLITTRSLHTTRLRRVHREGVILMPIAWDLLKRQAKVHMEQTEDPVCAPLELNVAGARPHWLHFVAHLKIWRVHIGSRETRVIRPCSGWGSRNEHWRSRKVKTTATNNATFVNRQLVKPDYACRHRAPEFQTKPSSSSERCRADDFSNRNGRTNACHRYASSWGSQRGIWGTFSSEEPG